MCEIRNPVDTFLCKGCKLTALLPYDDHSYAFHLQLYHDAEHCCVRSIWGPFVHIFYVLSRPIKIGKRPTSEECFGIFELFWDL